jgi:hypothetical protein
LGDEHPLLALDGSEVAFVPAAGERGEGLVEIAVELAPESDGRSEAIELGGVRLRLLEPAGA